MATILDASLLGFFAPVFIFLFVFAVIYAILEKTSLFGNESKALRVIAAFSVAAVSTFIGDSFTKLTVSILPWIVFLVIIMFLLFTIYLGFGVADGKKGTGEKEVWDIIGKTPIYIIVLLIILIGLSSVFEEELSPFDSSSGSDVEVVSINEDGERVVESKNPRSEALEAMTHPRMMGAIFMLIIASAAIKLLVDKMRIED